MVRKDGEAMFEKIIGGDPKIVNTGTGLRPYYMIEYYDNKDGETHLGFGSKCLSVVKRFLAECFEEVIL